MPRVGTVTLLFTDVVSSTELLEELGEDVADEFRREYFLVMRNSLFEHAGREVKTLGDGVMAAFASVVDALDCAIEIQRAVRARNEASIGPQLEVRIGINVGEAVVEEDDYFGRPVVVAKRLCDSAQGGQILVSDLVETMVDRRGAFVFRDLGWFALKGLAVPVPVREVLWTDETQSGAGTSGELSRPLPRPERKPTSREAWRKRRVVITLLTSLLVAALATAISLDRLLSDEGAQTNTPPEASDTALSDVDMAALPRWERVGVTVGGLGDQIVRRLTLGGPGLVAVGHDTYGGDLDGAVWISNDGIDWARTGADSLALDSPGDQDIYGIGSTVASLVAVGSDNSSGTDDAAVWFSDDGRSWSRTAASLRNQPGDQVMNRVADAGSGWVAVGRSRRHGDTDGMIWSSNNGLRWDPARRPAVFGGPGDQEIQGIGERGTRLVAVGFDAAGGDRDAAVWMSVDGGRWTRVEPSQFDEEGEQIMTTVKYIRGAFVAVGTDRQETGTDAAVWISPDGRLWKRAKESDAAFAGPGVQKILSVAGFHDTYFAVGGDGTVGSSDAAVWFSSDGEMWRRARREGDGFGSEGDQILASVVRFKGRLIAAGWDGSTGDLNASFWTGRIRTTPAP